MRRGPADPIALGDDFSISICAGGADVDTGTARIHNRARDPTLGVAGFPRVLRELDFTPIFPGIPALYGAGGYDVLPSDETVDLAIPQSLSQRIVYKQPFFGTHWGDAYAGDPVFVGPTASAATAVDGGGAITLRVRVKTRSGQGLLGFNVDLNGPGFLADSERTDANGEVVFAFTSDSFVQEVVSIDPPLGVDGSSTITTVYTYTRVTDQRAYQYQGGETLEFDLYLPLELDAEAVSDELLVVRARPTLPDGGPVPVSELTVKAYAFTDDRGIIAEPHLSDDGQDVDGVANDGVYAGSIAIDGIAGAVQLVVWATRSGFYQGSTPPSTGYARRVVDVPEPPGNVGTALAVSALALLGRWRSRGGRRHATMP